VTKFEQCKKKAETWEIRSEAIPFQLKLSHIYNSWLQPQEIRRNVYHAPKIWAEERFQYYILRYKTLTKDEKHLTHHCILRNIIRHACQNLEKKQSVVLQLLQMIGNQYLVDLFNKIWHNFLCFIKSHKNINNSESLAKITSPNAAQ
jgi:hypothetical protein